MISDVLPAIEVLVGIPLLIGVAINILKGFNIVKPGQAPKLSRIVNAVVFISLYAYGTLSPDVDWAVLDASAGTIAELGVVVLSLMAGAGGSKISGVIHDNVLKGLPFVGMSHS